MTTHTAKFLLTAEEFYQFKHTAHFEGLGACRLTAIHRPDSSTAHYWEAAGVHPDDILVSVICPTGEKVKRMVSPSFAFQAEAM